MRLGRSARWTLNLFPEAGEGGGCFQSAAPRARPVGGGVPDVERAQAEAGRRARGKVRRYCAANRLNRLGTLTYRGEGCHDPLELRDHVAAFFKALRSEVGELPYLWVPEWHPGGHGLHLHFAVGRYVSQPLIRDLWGHGFVHIKLLGNLPVGSGVFEEARLAARYLSKYVTKNVGEERVSGLHRYEVAQGFQPEAVPLLGRSVDDLVEQASERMGAAPEYVWRSSEQDGWQGPPAYWLAWSG